MCDGDLESYGFFVYRWRVAVKEHRCYACRETIRIKDKYHYTSGIWDKEPDSYKHCARCWKLLEHLSKTGEAVRFDLNCGEVYEGSEPEILALAFVTRDEMQQELS